MLDLQGLCQICTAEMVRWCETSGLRPKRRYLVVVKDDMQEVGVREDKCLIEEYEESTVDTPVGKSR